MSGRTDPARARWGDEPAGRGPHLEGVPHDGDEDGGAPDSSASGSSPGTEPGTEPGATPPGAQDATAEGGGVGEEVILADVVALTAQRDEYLDALQHLKAEFDNYRKRVARLQEEQATRAAVDLVGKLLPVLDNLDLACAHLGGEEADGEEARALGQARRQLLDVLAKEGLERVDAVEVPFDPMVHDAVAHAPAAGNGGGSTEGDVAAAGGGQDAVDEVMRAGYRWRGQVLRPAMVRVRG